MTARKPNNLPWIVLGAVGGLAILGLFGLGVYSGMKSVSDEISITMPEVTESATPAQIEQSFTIYVDEKNVIFFEGEPVENIKTLQNTLESLDVKNSQTTRFILRLSENSSHTRLIDLKDLLDGLGVKSVIEIIRSDAE